MPGLSFDTPFTKSYHKTPYDAIDPTQPSVSAAGKTILITAGHTGIGFSIAQNFATAGASHVILLARRAEVLEKAAKELSATHPKTEFHYFASSTTDHGKIKEIFTDIRSRISSHIDILVTSAAYGPPLANALDLPSEQDSTSFDTNFFGNVNLVRQFLARASEQESGKEKIILDVSTVAAHLLLPKLGVYGVSKLAFTQWVAHVQQDMTDKGVRVHSFHPGAVLTDGARSYGLTEESMTWDDVQLPGRFAVWLASEDAAFLKGRFVWANWDVRELLERKSEFERDPELLKVGLKGDP
ncbi:hypothetical protein ACHAQJ_008610, partial [Trichoderma viride]